MGAVTGPVRGFGVTFRTMFRKIVHRPSTRSSRHRRRRATTAATSLNRAPGRPGEVHRVRAVRLGLPRRRDLRRGRRQHRGRSASRPVSGTASIYQINYLRCIFCGLCIEACPTRSLTMSNDYELARDYPPGPDLHQGAAPGAAAARHGAAAAPDAAGRDREGLLRRRADQPRHLGRRGEGAVVRDRHEGRDGRSITTRRARGDRHHRRGGHVLGPRPARAARRDRHGGRAQRRPLRALAGADRCSAWASSTWCRRCRSSAWCRSSSTPARS